MRTRLGASVAVVLLLATAGCGGGGRPSEEDLSKALQKGTKENGQTLKLTKKQADCAAKVLENSKISDKGLQAIQDRDKSYKASSQDKSAEGKVLTKLTACVRAG